jgi:hypothetical protein
MVPAARNLAQVATWQTHVAHPPIARERSMTASESEKGGSRAVAAWW